MKHCWEQIDMLTAWDRDVQAAAMCNASEIFPNLVRGQRRMEVEDASATLDEEAGWEGAPFTDVGETNDDEVDYMGWLNTIDWDRV